MFDSTSLEFPSPLKLAGRMIRSSIYLAAIGSIASALVVGFEGGACDWLGNSAAWSDWTCSAAYATGRHNAALLAMFVYLAYLLAGPVLHGHNMIVVYSHETAWVHAVSNWIARLTGGVNPMTPGFPEIARAATDANHAYYRHNFVSFILIMLGTAVYAIAIFSPWLVANRFAHGQLMTTAMILMLTFIYIFVASTFLWLGAKVLMERRHKEEAET